MKLKLSFLLFFSICFSFGQVGPLLNTTWNQGCNYNTLMPSVSSGGSCGKAWTGCNATAIGQIMKYYSFPSTGMGTHCNTNASSNCVNYSLQTYNYSAMPSNVTTSNAEVATLMYDLGVAVNMLWSGSSSDSFFSSEALKRYYKYSPKMYPTATYLFASTADLIVGIKAELDAGRPVYAKGGNHFYLIDGYNSSNQFHCNFGWGGTHNGYYAINSVVNGAGTFTPVNFLFYIKPMEGDLELATETIAIASNMTTNPIEFTSLSNWSVVTDVPWISLSSTSGVSGYFNAADGTNFTATLNNGEARTGHITLTNGTSTKIITVNQAASPLGVSTNQLDYDFQSDTQSVTTSWFSWGTWAATASDTWISISPSSGTGNANINITCTENTDPTTRNGFVTINAGSYQRTIQVNQTGNILNSATFEFTKFNVFPNPTSDNLNVSNLQNENIKNITLKNLLGEQIPISFQKQNMLVSLDLVSQGVYVLTIETDTGFYHKKIIKK